MPHILVLSLLAFGGIAQAQALPGKRFMFQTTGTETRLRLAALAVRYRLKCNGVPGETPALHGTARFAGREHRFELPRARTRVEVGLGTVEGALPPVAIELDPHPSCEPEFLEITPRDQAFDTLGVTFRQVLANVPFIGVRPDQLRNRETDYRWRWAIR